MIIELIKALSAGRQLKNSVSWKNAQATSSALLAIMGAVLAALSLLGVNPQITGDQLSAIAGGIAAVFGAINAYTTVATSPTIGLQTTDDRFDEQTSMG